MTDFLKRHEGMDPDNRVKNRLLREPAVIQDLDLAMRLVLLLLLLLLPLQVVHLLLPLLVLLLVLLLLLLLLLPRMSLSPRRTAEVALRVQGYRRGGKVCVGASISKTLGLLMLLPR